MKGKVYLVGAGPGDPELLTMKAARTLRSADVVLHDALISPQVLDLVPAAARLLSVGKRCGTKSITQDEINALLISFAAEGRLVVRLKNGDPLIFGRAGEEIDALRDAGIDFEIVPGITSAVAAAAAAQISLTDRRASEQVLLISAHHAAGKPAPHWGNLISSPTTIVVYMPGPHRGIAKELMQAGLSGQTPCVVVSKVSMPEQQSYRSTLGGLGSAPGLSSPSLLIIGETTSSAGLPEFLPVDRNPPETETEINLQLS